MFVFLGGHRWVEFVTDGQTDGHGPSGGRVKREVGQKSEKRVEKLGLTHIKTYIRKVVLYGRII